MSIDHAKIADNLRHMPHHCPTDFPLVLATGRATTRFLSFFWRQRHQVVTCLIQSCRSGYAIDAGQGTSIWVEANIALAFTSLTEKVFSILVYLPPVSAVEDALVEC
jgi:hypothetical protein